MPKMPTQDDPCEEGEMNFAFSTVGGSGTHYVTTSGQMPKLQQNTSNCTQLPQVVGMVGGVNMGDGVQYIRTLDGTTTLQATPQFITVPIQLPGTKPGDPQPTVQIQVLSPNLALQQQQHKYQMQIPIQGFQQGLQVVTAMPSDTLQLMQQDNKEQIQQNLQHQVFITPNNQIIISNTEEGKSLINNNTTPRVRRTVTGCRGNWSTSHHISKHKRCRFRCNSFSVSTRPTAISQRTIWCRLRSARSLSTMTRRMSEEEKEENVQEEAGGASAAEARQRGDLDVDGRRAHLLLPAVHQRVHRQGAAGAAPGLAQDREALHLRHLRRWVEAEGAPGAAQAGPQSGAALRVHGVWQRVQAAGAPQPARGHPLGRQEGDVSTARTTSGNTRGHMKASVPRKEPTVRLSRSRRVRICKCRFISTSRNT
ncbi:unnamed protein product [Leptidea sinapis]|uniref:Uncharacterized protein n=2 Tax=Leptidea sinapis TaxID=189913 RepID=A0A5E4QPG6_9NEOP|nr:unnamed protein product [Leptidea sinapis]